MTTVKELLEHEDFFDAAILRHGFTDYMRDYEIVVTSRQNNHDAIYRYQFVGCVEATYTSQFSGDIFSRSLSDEFVYSGPDYPEKDVPEGFIWGVRYSDAYPGLKYIDGGKRAKHWSAQLGRRMHEVTVETQVFHLRLVFADVRVGLAGTSSQVTLPKDYPLQVTAKTSDGGIE